MALDGYGIVVKRLLFSFNLIFWSFGLTILGFGIWLYADLSSFLTDLAGISWLSAPILLIAVGVIVPLLGFLSCCGAALENKCLLYTFGCLLTITLLAEITAGTIACNENLDSSLKKTMAKYGDDKEITQGWDDAQEKMKCCGVDAPTDWGLPLPSSCCADSERVSSVCTYANAYDIGCYKLIKNWLSAYAPIGIPVIILAVIQLMGIVFACCLGRQIGRVQYQYGVSKPSRDRVYLING